MTRRVSGGQLSKHVDTYSVLLWVSTCTMQSVIRAVGSRCGMGWGRIGGSNGAQPAASCSRTRWRRRHWTTRRVSGGGGGGGMCTLHSVWNISGVVGWDPTRGRWGRTGTRGTRRKASGSHGHGHAGACTRRESGLESRSGVWDPACGLSVHRPESEYCCYRAYGTCAHGFSCTPFSCTSSAQLYVFSWVCLGL